MYETRDHKNHKATNQGLLLETFCTRSTFCTFRTAKHTGVYWKILSNEDKKDVL